MIRRSDRVASILGGLAIAAAAVSAQVDTRIAPGARNPLAGDAAAVRQGAVLFRQECTFCHGTGARGGMRGPDLTTGSWTHGGADAEIATTILNGVAGTAMPPNALKEQEIWQIVTYLRSLEQPPAAPRGDPQRGEALFTGTLRCASCHLAKGRGGRLGPELTTVGSSRSRAYIVESIGEPNKHLTELRGLGEATQRYDTLTVVTADGRSIVGVPVNEDTFTVQMMDTSEKVYSFDKKSLRSIRHEDRSLMPAYGANRLNDADLDDLVAYLQTLRAPTVAR